MSINELKNKLTVGTELVIYNYILKTIGRRKVTKQTPREMTCIILDDGMNKDKEIHLTWKFLKADIGGDGDIILTDKNKKEKLFRIAIVNPDETEE